MSSAGKAPAAAVAPRAAHEENPNLLKFVLMGMTLSETKSFLYGRHVVSPLIIRASTCYKDMSVLARIIT